MAYLTEKEKCILFSAIQREENVCKEHGYDDLVQVCKRLTHLFSYNRFEKDIRNKAIDEFAERLKERLKDMQMAEMQGEDVCPYGDTLEECPYINHELGCQYCAREQTIKDVDEIAEQMKKGV